MEIRRFGPGHRRPEGPPGTSGITGAVIHSDERGVISELAFSRRGAIIPHANPNVTYFIVISGGGYVQVGEERGRVNHGEAVLWPPDVPHGAYTDGSEMRAIIVELPDRPADGGVLLEGSATQLAEGAAEGGTMPARGALAERQLRRDEYDTSEGEPW